MICRHSTYRWLGASVALGAATVIACGPFFPESALVPPRGILQPPLFHFQGELNQTPLPPDIRPTHPPGSPAYTLDLEMAEMEQIVADMPDRDAWLQRYRALRRAMLYAGDSSEHSMRQEDSTAAVNWSKAKRDLAEVTAPLPEDVRLYLQGAAARRQRRPF